MSLFFLLFGHKPKNIRAYMSRSPVTTILPEGDSYVVFSLFVVLYFAITMYLYIHY